MFNRSSYFRQAIALSMLLAGSLAISFGCSRAGSSVSSGGSDVASANGGKVADAHASDARPSATEIQERIQKVQSDSHLSSEAKALLTKQMQNAMQDPRTPPAR